MAAALSWLVFPAALMLDLLLGDSHFLPHPIRWMGNAISRAEPQFRKLPISLVFSGTLFALSLVLTTWLLGWLTVTTAGLIHPVLKICVETILIYYCLAISSLNRAAMAVYEALFSGDLTTARQRVSWIVGRNVETLNETGVSRAAVETVAENLVDGILSPLFFAAIGGAPLCLAFKMISTLDSMVGYKNERYIHFGKAGARLDDLANFIPARLSVIVIAAAAHILGGAGKRTLRTALTAGKNHASPNAGFPEAAFAGALRVRLGGPDIYHGIRLEKPYICPEYSAVLPRDIPKACQLMVLSSLLWFAPAWYAVIFF